MDRNEIIFDVVDILQTKHGSLSPEQKEEIIKKIIEANEEDLSGWINSINQIRKQDSQIVKNINILHERKLKKIEQSMKTAADYSPLIIKDGMYDTDVLMKRLEQLFM